MSDRPKIEYVIEEGSLHKYRTEIPNTVVRGIMGRGLSLPARWMYVYLKSIAGDKGMCWQNTETMAKGAQLSKGAVHQAKKELIQAKLIAITPGNKGKHQTDKVRILDIWDQNMQEFSSCTSSPHELVENSDVPTEEQEISARVHHMNWHLLASSPHELASSPDEHASSPHELKKISLKKIPEKNEESSPNGEDMSDSSNPPPTVPKYTKKFEQFWKTYPNKKGKQEAWRKWRGKKLEAIGDLIIQSVLQHQHADKDWQKGYIPNPATYLHQGRYEDELSVNALGDNSWEAKQRAAIERAFAEEPAYESN